MSRQNLSESLAQYSVRSFATFLREQAPYHPTTTGAGRGGRSSRATPVQHTQLGGQWGGAGGAGGKLTPGYGQLGGLGAGGVAAGGPTEIPRDTELTDRAPDTEAPIYSLQQVLQGWGPCRGEGPCIGDNNGDGIVDGADLTLALSQMGGEGGGGGQGPTDISRVPTVGAAVGADRRRQRVSGYDAGGSLS